MRGHYNEDHMVDARSAAILFPMGGYVCHQHTRAIGPNAVILKEYDVPVVVLYRNILDTLVSWEESCGRDEAAGRGPNHTFMPTHVPAWEKMSKLDRRIHVAYNILPWYFSFFVSWKEADANTLFMNYKEFYSDQVKGLQKIGRFIGMVPSGDISHVTKHQDGRFSVGKSGRGRELLEPEVIEIAYAQARSWGPQWSPILIKELFDERSI
jgi:uncharacterized protein (UPF0297 family)